MTASMVRTGPAVELPAGWPEGLSPEVLGAIDLPTPFLACDLDMVADRFTRFRAALPRVRPHYAVKCNPAPEVLRTVAAQGAGFEVASLGELRMLQGIGVAPADVLYSNTVKPAAHVAAAAEAGLWRFAADSAGELGKIARVAPGSAVYVRIRVDDGGSVFPLSRKFGAEVHHARALLQQTERLGLRPYGLTFHVGSQCVETSAWRRAIASAGRLMRQLAADGIRLEMLDVGGGFPASYGAPVPSIDQIGTVVETSLDDLLPYQPPLLVAEPGRHMVAETAVMVASVLGREQRAGEEWLYLDVGAYNGLMETQQMGGRWPFPMWSSRHDHSAVDQVPVTVTGPSCDSSDTMFYGAPLPVTLAEGDRLFIASAGAYTLSYASSFNGFPPPGTHFTGG
ncbi:type III PLP-dependent enzyme [Geodermatophilus sp. DSM 44513]|uniref:type III PLP-dependent enzyme n=1 Tax=Geodermatophilus sp. DSM 44513 TaxID=1528104 RepID=UPI001273CE80|nr:type III PLP-dependent enzyme [Geodermatophilus sp. DSM 44513]WNV75580.1 type III PLP-dependent enzyme [Geodermatophilus sp. DSM 44513]